MAKGKQSSGKNYVSKGERFNVDRSISKAVRRDIRLNSPLTRLLNQRDAWKKGRNVVLTVPNPDGNNTKAPFIRVNAREVWGNPKDRVVIIKGND